MAVAAGQEQGHWKQATEPELQLCNARTADKRDEGDKAALRRRPSLCEGVTCTTNLHACVHARENIIPAMHIPFGPDGPHVRRESARTRRVCACVLGAESRTMLLHSSHAREHTSELGGRGALSEQLLQRMIELEDENRALRSDLVTLRCGSVRVCTAAQAV